MARSRFGRRRLRRDPLVSGPFKLKKNPLQLFEKGWKVPLVGQPLQILHVLFEANGEIVSRRHLEEVLWPDCEKIDVSRRMNTAIRALRRAVGDIADQPNYIETIRGRGYRWMLPVKDQALIGPPLQVSVVFLMITFTLALGIGMTNQFDSSENQTPDRVAAQTANVDSPGSTDETNRLLLLSARRAIEGEWDWIKAESFLRSALENDPGSEETHRELAWLLAQQGKEKEAWCHLEKALGPPEIAEATRFESDWRVLDRNNLAHFECTASEGRR